MFQILVHLQKENNLTERCLSLVQRYHWPRFSNKFSLNPAPTSFSNSTVTYLTLLLYATGDFMKKVPPATCALRDR